MRKKEIAWLHCDENDSVEQEKNEAVKERKQLLLLSSSHTWKDLSFMGR